MRRENNNRKAIAALGAVLIAALAFTTGCTQTPTAPDSQEPFLYLVLGQRAFTPFSLDPFQVALLLTTGTPSPAKFRSAERFDMTRSSDHARFAWRAADMRFIGDGTDAFSANLSLSNYILTDTASEGLTARDIRPGERYLLDIETQGVEIRGAVTVPEGFTVRIVPRADGSALAVWPAVRGAAGYTIATSTITETSIIHDTTFVVPPEVLADGFVQVLALDPNAASYLGGAQVRRAGIDAGFGVFGAITGDFIRLRAGQNASERGRFSPQLRDAR